MRTSGLKISTCVMLIVMGLLSLIPNFLTPGQLSGLPRWVSDYRVTLGLDLRGGSHLVLEIDSKTLIREKLQSIAHETRVRLKENRNVRSVTRLVADSVTVELSDPSQRTVAENILQRLVNTVDHSLFISGDPDISIQASGEKSLRISLTKAGMTNLLDRAVRQSLEIVRSRIDQVGVAEPTIQRVGANRILIQLPGVQDPARIKNLLGSTAKLSFHRVLPEDSTHLSDTASMKLPDRENRREYLIERTPTITGEHLAHANLDRDQQTHEPVVSFRFDTTGARIFARFTTSHINEPFAIVLDGKILSAPVIREPIIAGSGQISGGFTAHEAGDLATLLRSGALPAPLSVLEERTVGADLGQDAIKMGAWTGLAGIILVFAFMLALYGSWGMLANMALLLNVGLTFAALSWLGATLTLPGIAGIVLGIGLAVDANVLINERIREETRKGLGAMAAMDAGFKRAFATIVDSNITTLIATALLFMFGSGPVRGFAITMGLGIIISMFTAVSVVRIAMEIIIRKRKLKQLRIEAPIHLVPDGTSIPFMRARMFGIAVSVVLSLASIMLFIKPGLNYGIDFKGGVQMEIRTGKAADLAALRQSLEGLKRGEVSLQTFGNDNTVLVRTERQDGNSNAGTRIADEMKSAVLKVHPDANFPRVEVVGPRVSGELVTAGITSVVLASIAMLLYIWIRFELPFAIGAIATLVLDITKTLGFFALTGLDFNLTAIAALLTLIGYSVNDKVVVFDRMRENMRLYKKMELGDIINRSINETLGRSLYTSATAFLAMLPMAFMGGSAVESFAIPMLFGIFIAASSSVFIAAPILLFLGDWRRKRANRLPDLQALKSDKAAAGQGTAI